MNKKQMIAVFAPIVLVIVMYFIFHFLSEVFRKNWRIGWFLGLTIYWIIWGALFPLFMIGEKTILEIIQPQQLNLKNFLLVGFPIVMAAIYRFVPNMNYEKPTLLIYVLVLLTSFGNGFFEEVLWRGVYMELFPQNIFFRIIWPSIWFALWHYVPGSVNPSGNVIGLMIGSGFFGFYLSFLARMKDTIFWTILAHTLGGIIMVL